MREKVYSIFAIAVIIAGIITIYVQHKRDSSSIGVEKTSATPEQTSADLLQKCNDEFINVGLYTILGENNMDDYVVDADPQVQRKIDEILWGYCQKTSNIFSMQCKSMRERLYYDSSAFDVLTSIIWRQKLFLDKYASEQMKRDADVNTFKYEEEILASVLDPYITNQSRVMELIGNIRSGQI